MAFKKGKSGNPNGKPLGAVNKSTKNVKDMFSLVFTDLQEDSKANLMQWAKENPTDFYKLCSKLIPAAVEVDAKNKIITVVPPVINVLPPSFEA